MSLSPSRSLEKARCHAAGSVLALGVALRPNGKIATAKMAPLIAQIFDRPPGVPRTFIEPPAAGSPSQPAMATRPLISRVDRSGRTVTRGRAGLRSRGVDAWLRADRVRGRRGCGRL